MKRGHYKLSILVFSFFLFSFLLQAGQISAAMPASLKVDASKHIGNVPELMSSSVWITNPSEKDKYILTKFFKENRPAVVQLTLPLGGTDLETAKKVLKDYLSNEGLSIVVKKLNEYNSTLIVGFDPVPMRKWLSLRKNDERGIEKSGGFTVEMASPPLNYALWGDVVKFVLSYMKDSLGVKNIGFYVGHEPNRDWLGSEETFFKYYEYSAKAAKSVSPSIKVGGMGSWDVYGRKLKCDAPQYAPYVQEMCRKEGGWANQSGAPMLKDFITYVSKHNLPLDFINWHSFGVMPENFPNVAATIKGWLKDAGIKEKNVKLFPADWTYWSNKYPADYLDTQETAAYYIQSLYYMWKGGIQWQGYDFNINDNKLEKTTKASRKSSTFIGDWGIFTRTDRIGEGVIKPVYNAMKALSMVTHENKGGPPKLISAEFLKNDSMTAIATSSAGGKKVSVIISNFVPTDKQKMTQYVITTMLSKAGLKREDEESLRQCIADKGEHGDREKAIMQCKEALLSSISDPKKIEAINYLARLYSCRRSGAGKECLAEASRDLKFRENREAAEGFMDIFTVGRQTRPVDIAITNIPFKGKATLSTYVIDSNHSNACGFNKKTESSPTNAPCGIGGSVDDAVWRIPGEVKTHVKRELEQENYPPDEVNSFLRIVEECKTGFEKCISQKKISSESRKKLMNALQKAKEIAYTDYGLAIDKVNKLKEVSLEGSRVEKQVEVSKGLLNVKASLEPNAVYLLILEGI